MRKLLQKVARVVIIVFVYVCEEVVLPLAHIDLCQFAASHEGVDDGSIFGGIMVSAEEIVLASQSQRSHAVLDEIVVNLVPAIGGVA